MSDRPENSSGGRRRGGPLGDDAEQTETRREPLRRGSDDATQRISDDATQRISTDDATRQIPTRGQAGSRRREGSGGRDRAPRSSDTQEFEVPTRVASREEEGRRARPARGSGVSGGRSAPAAASSGYTGYSTGYNEVLREREEYLRDIYGGVDWLASFVGFVFTLIFAGLLGAAAGLFLLAPLGLQQSLASGQLTSTALTGFAVVAGVAFFAFLFGGYISGRMARYDGGRNGAMVLLWMVLVAALVLVLSGVLGQVISGTPAGNLVGAALNFGSNAANLIGGLGTPGIVIAGGVLLAALLGGMIGGRLGSRYHREIDYTP